MTVFLQIFGKPWNFGQFESVVIQCILYLLDEKSDMAETSRGNVIAVCRKISALVSFLHVHAGLPYHTSYKHVYHPLFHIN